MEDPHALISPEAHHRHRSGEGVRRALEKPFIHPGQIPEVEHIVKLGRRALKVDSELPIQVEGHFSNFAIDLLNGIREAL
eukprot:1321784-Amorphochlora_amoeboformis.AAC.2